jgi:hypothetical protein
MKKIICLTFVLSFCIANAGANTIHNSVELEVNSGLYTRNELKGGAGGVFSLIKSTVTFIPDMIFSSNSATGGTGAVGSGGAISVSDSYINFNLKVNFSTNTARGGTGAVLYSYTGGSGGAAKGGAIYSVGASRTVFKGETSFVNNKALGGHATDSGYNERGGNGGNAYGGALYYENVNNGLTFEGEVEFNGNAAISGGGSTGMGDGWGGHGGHSYGGAIYLNNTKNAVFNNTVVFSSNSASGGGGGLGYGGGDVRGDGGHGGSAYGGTIFITNSSYIIFNGTVSLSNSYIKGGNGGNADSRTNGDVGGNGGNAYGGAIYVDNKSYINFNNDVIIENNKGSGGTKGSVVYGLYGRDGQSIGGSLYIVNHSTINFTGTKVEITSNASNYAGAIYIGVNSLANFSAEHVEISYNNSISSNGVIYFDSTSLADFKNTPNLKAANNISNNGGFLYLYKSITFAGNASFRSNKARNLGGTFYINNGVTLTFSGTNTDISYSSAAKGAAIYAAGTSVINFDGTNTEISYNNSTNDNGVFYFDANANVKFNNTNLKAVGNISNNGGFLYLSNKGITVFGGSVELTSNQARTNGGALYISTTNLIFNGNVIISSNMALSGAAIYAAGNSVINFNGTDTEISYNNSTNDNGIFYLAANANVKFNNTKLKAVGNISNNGGFLYLYKSMTFDGAAAFISNQARGAGGTFYISTGVTLTFNGDSTIISYSSAAAGAAIYAAVNSVIDFNGTDTEISYNNSVNDNGIIYLAANANIKFNNTNLKAIGNISNNGGFLYLSDKPTATFDGLVYLVSNTAHYDGGALYNVNSDIKFNNKTVLSNNRAKENGGALYLSAATVAFNADIIIEQNRAQKGGAIYVFEDSAIKFRGDKVKFISNNSENGDGIIYLSDYSILEFSNTKELEALGNISNNGGFLYLRSETTVSLGGNINISKNTARIDGGGIYLNDLSHLEISAIEAQFLANKSSNDGGAIRISANASMNVSAEKGEFRNNEAYNGGAVYINQNGNFHSYDMDFIGNYAQNHGGAIFISGQGDGATVSINAVNRDVLFNKNGAKDNYNDFYLERYSHLTFNSEKFRNIVLNGGITGAKTGNKIVKTGEGNLNISGFTDYKGEFYIKEGTVLVSESSATLGKVFVSSAAHLKLANKSPRQQSVINVYGGEIDGTIELEGNYYLKRMNKIVNLNGETVSFGENSKLIFKSYGIGKIDYIFLEGYESGEIGSVSMPKNSRYEIKYEDDKVRFISYNWTEFSSLPNSSPNESAMAQMLDKIAWRYDGMPEKMHQMIDAINKLEPSDQQEALEQISGNIFANILKSQVRDRNITALFKRMNAYQWDKRQSLWAAPNYNDLRYKANINFARDFSLQEQGFAAGYDILSDIGGAWFGGAYFGYGRGALKQGNNKGETDNVELGLYAMKMFKNGADKINIMSNFAFGRQNYRIKREIYIDDYSYFPQSSFYTNSLKFALRSEYAKRISDGFYLKPFLSLQNGYIANDMIRESGSPETELVIEQGGYLRSLWLGGIGGEYKHKMFLADIEIYGGTILAGQEGHFIAKLLNTASEIESAEIKGGKENSFWGLNGGFTYPIRNNLTAGVNANIEFGDASFSEYFGLSIDYKFGEVKIEEEVYKYEKAKKSYSKGRFMEATELLKEVLSINPDYIFAIKLYEQIKSQIYKNANNERELDYGKMTYAKAYEAYYNGNFNQAVSEWKKFIEFCGDKQDVREYLDKTIKIMDRKKYEEIEENSAKMLNLGIAEYQSKRWLLCIKHMEDLQKYVMENKFPESDNYYNKAKKYINNAVKELSKNIKSDNKDKDEELKIDNNIDEEGAQEKYNEGLELYAKGKYLEAQRTWEQVLRLNPNHAKAKVALANVNAKNEQGTDE